MSKEDTTPAALIIGGGIAGIQAALDIANAGFKVYLVEREPSIGGRMAQLDKTFPTLDCSACILTPRMVEVGRHPNIELLTLSEVVAVKKEANRFHVRVKCHPRYVDETRCTGCGECAEVCPVELPSEYNCGLSMRKAIAQLSPQAVPNAYYITKKPSPCKITCPAHIPVQGYVALVAQGKFDEALRLIYRAVPFAGVLGRVCPGLCEVECKRQVVDAPLAIAWLKRAAFDHASARPRPGPAERHYSQRVAIVGAGPAGLSAAYDLARMGYGVTVFEALPVAGGMMAVGIPEYRLPRDVLSEEIANIEALGVEIRLNTPVGNGGPPLDDLRQEYDAIFLAVGAHGSRRLGVPGEEVAGVLHATEFLRRLNLGDPPPIGQRVAVIGGGNSAIDAARSALRLGADEVTVVYRRSRREMPAIPREVDEAEREGVRLHFLASPVEILSEDGRLRAVRCIRMELGELDESGRRRPIPIQGSEFDLEADTLIIAIGQRPILDGLGYGMEVTRRGTIAVDPETLATSLPGVFAGGDACTGPATVVEAVGAGKVAAESIHRYLQGLDLREGRVFAPIEASEIEVVILADVKPGRRAEMPTIPLAERRSGFAEVERGFGPELAMAEAARCLACAVCSECLQCVSRCELGCIDHNMKEQTLNLDVEAIIVATGFDPFDPTEMPEFGYGQYPEVMTGLEFERLVSASGPTAGEIKINGKEPKEVVFIQCVGSRDAQHGHPYCSRVCCMYTAKQAHLICEKLPDARVTIFYTDIRAFGKGFEEFYDRVRREGVLYRRGNPSEIIRRNGRLIVRAEDTLLGEPVEVPADLVVLAVGIQPRADAEQVASLLGLARSDDGFLQEAHPKLQPVDTGVEGIYIAGCCQGPKDIPDTVAQAKAAAAAAMIRLVEAK